MTNTECKRFTPLLEDFVDGEVAGDQLTELQSHLRQCTACFGRVETARQVQGLVRAATPPMVTPELLRRRITKDFKVSRTQRMLRQPWVRPALAAACLLLLLAGAFFLIPRGGPSEWAVAMVSDHTMCWMNVPAEPAPPADLEGKVTEFMKGTDPGIPTVKDSKLHNLMPCPVKGAVASAHVFYKRPGNVQLSMYFAVQDKWTKKLPSSPQEARIDQVESGGQLYHVASWQHDGVVTGLVASVPREDMEAIMQGTTYQNGQAVIPDARPVALH